MIVSLSKKASLNVKEIVFSHLYLLSFSLFKLLLFFQFSVQHLLKLSFPLSILAGLATKLETIQLQVCKTQRTQRTQTKV